MKRLKQTIAWILLAVTLFSAVGCQGEFHYGIGGKKPEKETGEGYVPPVLNDDPTDDFVVTVLADGAPYSPRMEMFVYWSDGFSIHTAKLDEKGEARIDGLDGDYRVTLSAVPNEYAYDPNNNLATNDARCITIDLYTLNHLSGSGTGIYDCYHFSRTGVYAAIVNSADDAIYFQYAPDRNGTYTIESWVDISEDTVDPYIEVYGGHSQYKFHLRTTYDGGKAGSYTANFIHTVQIADENISASGQATYTFAVKADSKTNQYPVTVIFAVKRNGGFELDRPGKVSGTKIPEFDFSDFRLSDHEYGEGYTLTYPEYRYAPNRNLYVFDEQGFKLWELEKGGDGFYHVFDRAKYPETGGYGPILYANITTPCRFIDRSFHKIEYNNAGETDNAALSVNGWNYKHFIEGYTFLSTLGNINGGSYYCIAECTCHNKEVSVLDWACLAGCTSCHANCRQVPAGLYKFEGYQAYSNSDGMVPVTRELQEFLLGYCQKESFFRDGTGTLEKRLFNGNYYQAVGDSGWLFACAYYESN